MPDADVEKLIPVRTQKPRKWGERTLEWEGLDRGRLMQVLHFVRERYLKKCREHFLTGPEEKKNRACLTVLEMVRQDTLDLLSRVPDPLFNRKPDGEKWSYRDLVNHLATDEDGEFFPGPPDGLLHRIRTDCIHIGQLGRFLRKDSLLPPADHFD